LFFHVSSASFLECKTECETQRSTVCHNHSRTST
jgi:hypothetical protein